MTRDPTELHTVSFGVGNRALDIATMTPQPQGPPLLLVTPDVAAPAGGRVRRGAGLYNSGFMLTHGPGDRSHTLTVTRKGAVAYLRAVHEQSGMRATITVQSTASATKTDGTRPRAGAWAPSAPAAALTGALQRRRERPSTAAQRAGDL